MKCTSISVFLVIGLTQFLTTVAQSPCPDIFEYQNDENGVYGVVTLKPDGRKATIDLRINYTIAAKLTTDYVGEVKPEGGTNAILEYNKGRSIRYRVDFPVSSPLPRITGIYVNDNLICWDDPDTLETSNFVTTITIQRTLFLKGGSNVVYPTTLKRPSAQTVNLVSNNQPNRNTVTFTKHDEPTNDYDQTNRPSYWEVIKYTPPPRQVYPSFEVNITPQGSIADRWRPERPDPDDTTTEKSRPPARKPAATESNDESMVQCGKASSGVGLIWRGESYSPGEWPWLVAIYQTSATQLNFVCSGTLVSDRHIVTAAHCMQNKEAKDILVKLGVFNLSEWGGDIQMRKLVSAIAHKDFNKKTFDNDIAVFTMEQSVQFNTNIKPICLWGTNSDLNRVVGQTGVVTGWGDSEFGKGGHGEPRMIRLPIVSTPKCRSSKQDFHSLTSDTTLCAGNRDGSGPCSGDSGGGLYLLDDGRWKLRGIVSHALSSKTAEKRCNLDEYIVFTDAAKYNSWILRYMQF